jgi:nitrilase
MSVGLAQIAPVWLDKKFPMNKVHANVSGERQEQFGLILLSEAVVLGFPFKVFLHQYQKEFSD